MHNRIAFGWLRHRSTQSSSHLYLRVLSVLDSIRSLSNEQFESLQVVHHGGPMDSCVAIFVRTTNVNILLEQLLDHELVDNLHCSNERGHSSIRLEVHISTRMVQQELKGM